MANRVKGEATLQVGDDRYTAILDMNALCELEDVTGQDAMTVLSRIETGTGKAKDMRAFLWATLQCHHEGIDIRTAGDILTECPDAVITILAAAFPEVKVQKPGNAKRPRKAAA